MIKNLSKADYYKSQNIPQPRSCLKLALQPPVRSHLLDVIPNLSTEIMRHVENKIEENQINLEYIYYEKLVHTMEEDIQKLRNIIISKDDQLYEIKSLREKDQRKIGHLQKDVFDLKNQIQKNQHDYKTIIDFGNREFAQHKNDYQQKIYNLQLAIDRLKTEKQVQYEALKKTYEARLISTLDNKEVFKNVSQMSIANLRQQLQNQLTQNKRMKNQFISAEQEHIENFKLVEQENFTLKERLQNDQMSNKMEVMKLNSQINSKNLKIQQIQDKIKDLIYQSNNEREKFQYEKQYILKIKMESQKKWKQNYQSLTNIKEKLDAQINGYVKQLNEISDIKNRLVKQNADITHKLQLMEQRHSDTEQHYKNKLQQERIKLSGQFQLEMNQLKQKYTSQHESLETDFQQRVSEIATLNQKIFVLNNQLSLKKGNIKKLDQDLRKLNLDYQSQRKEKIKLQENAKTLKGIIEKLKESHIQELNHLQNKLKMDRTQQFEKQIQSLTEFSNNLKIENQRLTQLVEQQNSNNQQTLKEKESIINTLNERINNFTTQIEKMRQKSMEIKNQSEKQRKWLNDQIQELQDKVQLSQKNLHTEEQKIHQILEQKQNEKNEMQEEYKQKMNQMSKQFKQKQQKLCLLLTSQQKELESNAEKIQGLENSIYKKVQKYREAMQRTIEQINQKKKIQEQLEQQQKMHGFCKFENNQLRNNLQARQQHSILTVQQIKKAYSDLTQKVESQYRQKNKKNLEKIDGLEQQLEKIRKMNNQREDKYHQKELQVQKYVASIQRMNIENKKMIQNIQRNEDEIMTLNQKIYHKQEKLRQVQEQCKTLKVKNIHYMERLSTYQKDIKQMKRSVNLEESSAKKMKERVQYLESICNEKSSKLQTAREEINLCKKAKNDLESSLNIEKQKVSQLKKQLNQYKLNLSEAQKAYDQKARSTIVKIQYEYKEELNKMASKLEQSQNRYQQARQILEQRQEIIKNLETQAIKLKQIYQDWIGLKRLNSKLLNDINELKENLNEKTEIISKISKKLREKGQKESLKYQQIENKSIQLETSLKIAIQKVQIQSQKYQNCKQALLEHEKKTSFLTQELEIARQQMKKLQKNNKYAQDIENRFKQTLQEQTRRLKEIFYNEKIAIMEKMKEEFNKKIKQHLKTIQTRNNEKAALKKKLNDSKSNNDKLRMYYETELKKMEITIRSQKRRTQFLIEYKKRWDRISGQVKQYEDLEDDVPEQPFLLQSLKSNSQSILIQEPEDQIQNQNILQPQVPQFRQEYYLNSSRRSKKEDTPLTRHKQEHSHSRIRQNRYEQIQKQEINDFNIPDFKQDYMIDEENRGVIFKNDKQYQQHEQQQQKQK